MVVSVYPCPPDEPPLLPPLLPPPPPPRAPPNPPGNPNYYEILNSRIINNIFIQL